MRQHIYRMLATGIIMIALCTGRLAAKEVQVPKMYMFGFAASFNDTIVHFTNVMEVDSVWIEKKNNFLLGRQLYSRQLRNYLSESKSMPQRTCIVMYGLNRSKLEKKMLKMRKLYQQSKDGKQHYEVRFLDDGEFSFKTLAHDDVVTVEVTPDAPRQESKEVKQKKEKQPKKGKK